MVSEANIREKIRALVENRIDLDTFEDWHAQNTWNIHAEGDSRAQRLAYAIELRLAEHSSEHLSEVDLLRELALLANPYFAATVVSTGSDTVTAARQWSVLSSDIRPVAASA